MDVNIESLLKLDLDSWKDAGTGESEFKELKSLPGIPVAEAKSAATQPPIAAQAPVAGKAPHSRKIEAIVASWPKDRDYDLPAGTPMLREVRFLRPEERTLVHKSALTKQFSQASEKVQKLYDALILGDGVQVKGFSDIAEMLLGILSSDPYGTLGLSLMRGNSLAEYQYRHAVHTCIVSMATAIATGYAKSQVVEIGMGGLVADVGMVMVPEDVLGKVGKLSVEELNQIHQHVQHSVDLLERVAGLPQVVFHIVLQHHERLSGVGYPGHLKEKNISHAARIVAIADTLCAMVHKRSHRDAMLSFDALDRVIKMSQMQFLDPQGVKCLAGWLSAYPVGSGVQLQSGRVGRVVAANLDDFKNPVVAILKNANGQALPMKQIMWIDLKTMPDDKIAKAIDDAEAGFKGLDGF
jgi:HD-GYP domain-containing protein (c-di-GMP phosphodiesterase class II)